MSDTPETTDYLRAENNIFFEGQKVAVIKADGKLQTLPGQASHRPAILAWLNDSTEPAPLDQPETLTLTKPKEGIPPCPEQDPRMGDKTPAVIKWYQTYHPEEFTKRYSKRRFTIDV